MGLLKAVRLTNGRNEERLGGGQGTGKELPGQHIPTATATTKFEKEYPVRGKRSTS
jgi:hypothetical protein